MTQDWSQTEHGIYVPSGLPHRRRRYGRPVGVDLFAGAGGFSLGMHQAGFHVAAALEFDPDAATTYLVNLARPGVQLHFDTDERAAAFERYMTKHLGLTPPGKGRQLMSAAPRDAERGSRKVVRPGAVAGSGWISGQPPSEPGCEHFWLADARKIKGSEILDALGLAVGDVDVVFGGPPCQGFSRAGKREVMDPRNSLVFEFARLVLEIQPKAMVVENVPGIMSMVTPEGVPVVDALARVLEDGGWSTFDAIKRSLLSSSGQGAALRSTAPPADPNLDEGQGPEQATLDLGI